MIRAVDHHPQANTLVRAYAEARAMRFAGTEADSTFTPVCEAPDEADSGWPTTRKFARSMYGTDAAWPDEPQYASPVQTFTPMRSRLGNLLMAAALLVSLAAIGVILAWRG